MENKEYQLLCTFLKDRYYISTMYRKSTANIANPWHFEMIIWEWDAIANKRGQVVDIDDIGTDEEQAIANHFTAVKSMLSVIAKEEEKKDPPLIAKREKTKEAEEAEEMLDGHGCVLKEGDMICAFKGDEVVPIYGTLHKNTEFPHVSDWFVKIEGGEDFVLNFEDVFKVNN